MQHTKLKPIADQVIVITGASSGIGLTTARLAAKRGARVMLTARSEDVLESLAREISDAGGHAAYLAGDIAEDGMADRVATAAVREFRRIDSWVNDAGVGLYGRLAEISLEDARRLFDVNFWGVVQGCNAAIPYLKRHGGALINLGSVDSDVPLPLQGFYVATKHAVRGYTDTLRIELEEAGAPIAVTLIKPTSIDTPFFEHARNYLPYEPASPPPVYDPAVVARTILAAAERPLRDIYVGGAAKLMGEMERMTPQLADRFIEKTMFRSQRSERPNRGVDILDHPAPPLGQTHGSYEGHVMRSSAYTAARTHRRAVAMVALGVGAAAAAGMKMFRGSDGRSRTPAASSGSPA